MERAILQQWLKAGVMDKHVLSPTEAGVPHGGICSPVMANLALDGLETVVKAYASLPTQRAQRAQVNLVRFADDCIITGRSYELLAQEITPLVEQFLRERGLELSPEKTRITHMEDGFDVLGQYVRKYGDKLLIKPARKKGKAFLGKIRKIVQANKQATTANLIAHLTPVIRGWATYHRHVASTVTFSHVDTPFSRWCGRGPNEGIQQRPKAG
jgi:RNA-directed DNA polymerase